MRESHAHIAGYGEALGLVDLSACSSLEGCLEVVRGEAERAAAGRSEGLGDVWIRLTGARPTGWRDQSRWPTRHELDRACASGASRVSCVIMSFDHHSAVANTRAMELAGLRAGDRPEPMGLVERDEFTGEATGFLLEGAAYQAWGAAPELSAAERRACVMRALEAFSRLGFREVHDLHSQDWLGPLLGEFEREGELDRLNVRVRVYPPMSRLERDFAGATAWTGARVQLGGGKLFLDGTLSCRTAMVLTPYRTPAAGSGPMGTMMLKRGVLEQGLATARRLGVQLAVHAIGDGAVRYVLDAAEAVSESRGGGGGSLWCEALDEPTVRIEHCELIDERDVGRFAELGVIAGVQPCHLLTDIEVLERELGGRLDRVLPIRELLASGCVPLADAIEGVGRGRGQVWFGSDAPIVRPDPGDSIQAAVYRRRAGAPEQGAIGMGQAISEATAYRCFGRRDGA
jgi:predicted amidohydrolase YtcJ